MTRTTGSPAPNGARNKRGKRLLALALVSDQLIRDRAQMSPKQRRALQRGARGLYRSLPDASRSTFARHPHERYPAGRSQQFHHQHR